MLINSYAHAFGMDMRALALFLAMTVYLFAGIGAFKLDEKFGHPYITTQAIDRVVREALPLGKVFCKDTIKDLVDYNKHTDYFEPMAEEAHCDGEKLNECSKRILDFKNEGIRLLNKAGAILANDGDADKLVDQARKKIGKALHTLQDFYAHSNYVEMVASGGGAATPHPSLGKSVLSNPRATDVICLDNFFTLVGTVLSSGYFPITESFGRWKDRVFCEPIPVGKCRHGFSLRKLRDCDGINKDEPRNDEPARTLFQTAQTLAISATTAFLKDIYTSLASDDARNAFLGSCGAKLAYIVDTTGSMGNSIGGVLAFLAQHATARKMSISKIILTLFNDPDPPTTYKFNDLSSFLAQLNSVTVDGGEDCPELMFGGIYAASQAAPRKAQLFVFSDADAKDSNMASLAAASIKRKLQRINYILTGNCGIGGLRRRTLSDLSQPTSASSGQFQHAWPTMAKSTAENAAGVARRFSPGGGSEVSSIDTSEPDSRSVMEIWNSVASSDYQFFTIPPDSIPTVMGAHFGSLQNNVAYLFNIEQAVTAKPTSPSCTSSNGFCDCATASFVVSDIQQDLLFVAVPNTHFTQSQIINSLVGPSTIDDSILTSLSYYGAASIRASQLPPGNYTYFACVPRNNEPVTLTLTGTAVTPFTLTSFTFLTHMGRLDDDELAPLLSTPVVGTIYPAFQITMSKSYTASDVVSQPLQNLIAEFVTVAGASITSFPILNISTSGDGSYLVLYSNAQPVVPMEPFYVVVSGLFNNSAVFRLSLSESVKPAPIALTFVPLLSDPSSASDSLFSAFTILPMNKTSILTFNLTNTGNSNITVLISAQPDVETTAINDLVFTSTGPLLLPQFSSSLASVNITPGSNVTHSTEFTLLVQLHESESGALLNSLILEATFVGCSSCFQDIGTCVPLANGGLNNSIASGYVCQCYFGLTNTSLCSTNQAVPPVPPVTCPVDAAGKVIVGSCRCNAGYSGAVTPSTVDPYYSNTCAPVSCPANSVGVNLPSGCTCSAGLRGSIVASTTSPFFTGTCASVACPVYSQGANVASGCLCIAGCSGTIVPSTTLPYYIGSCTPVTCPANSQGENVRSGCRCNAGYSGNVRASTINPYYNNTCTPVRCPANSVGANIPSGCTCSAGSSGSITATSTYPTYFNGTCAPVACPTLSEGLSLIGGCRCIPGYSGSVHATTVHPFYNITCMHVSCPANSVGVDVPTGCTCNAGFRGFIVASTTAPYFTGTCASVACPIYSQGANVSSGCLCKAGCSGSIVASESLPYFNGSCTPVLCPANSQGESVFRGCRCNGGYGGTVIATTVDPYYNNTCTPVICPANSAGTDFASGCVCNAGFRGTLTASTSSSYYSGTCTPVLCPAYSRGTNVVSGCQCDAGCGGFILASTNWPDYYIGSCTPVDCPASSQGRNVVSGCRCNAGYNGTVSPTFFYPYYNSTCVPRDCPANSVGINLPSGCQCNIGYSGTIVASSTVPFYSGTCTPIPCPSNSQGYSLLGGCQCNAGFTGSIVASLTYPFYSGSCNPVPCPANSRGANVGSGCLCSAGFSGSIVASTTSPYYSGTCTPSECPVNSQLDCATNTCRCTAGYSGTVVPSTVYPYYISTCAPVVCPPNSVGINVPSGCQCTAGHSGFIGARSTSPFYSGSCRPVPCPARSQGLNVASGCECIAGARGTIAASTTWPAYYTGTCSPVACPVNTRGTDLVSGCYCNAGYSGSVLSTKVDPHYFTSTCAPVTCPAYSVGINVPSGCTCKAGSTGTIAAHTVFPFYHGSCTPAICPANSYGANVVSGCQCNAGYSGTIVPSITHLFNGRCIPVPCPANSRGTSVISGCQCNAGYRGSIAPSTVSPFFSGTCSPVPCPANSRGLNVVSRCQCNPGFAGSIAASIVSPFYTGTCSPVACPSNSRGTNVPTGCLCDSGYSGSIVPSTFWPYYSGTCVRSPPPPPPRRPCVAGDALITTHRGTIAARDVVVGDILRGMDEREACSVVASTRIAPSGTVYGSFTAEHFVVVKNADGSNIIKPQRDALQAAVPARSMDLVNIATNCPAVQTADGQLFTPLSTVFCPSLTWSQYIPLYAGLLRMVAKTGSFWFNPITAYQDSSASSPLYRRGTNANVGPVSWQILLPSICDLMVACATDGSRCDDMEVLAASWIATHVKGSHLNAVRAAYPNLGDTTAVSGTLSADIRRN